MIIQWIGHEFHFCSTFYLTISNLERIEFLQEKSWLLFFFWFFIYFLVFLVLFVKSRLGFGFGLKMGLKGATFSKKHSQEQHIAHYTDWSRSQTSVHHFLKSRTFILFLLSHRCKPVQWKDELVTFPNIEDEKIRHFQPILRFSFF